MCILAERILNVRIEAELDKLKEDKDYDSAKIKWKLRE